MFTIKAYYETESDFTDFYNQLKGLLCPHCRLPGFLILHGFLYGYAEDQHLAKSKRGHRLFCSNRKNRKGCGKTFTLLLSSFIKHFTISTKALWNLLLNIAAGLPPLQAFKSANGPLTVSSVYRLCNRFQQVQARIRTLLLSVKDPPLGDGISDPAVQTIWHLHSLVHDDSCPIAAFQLRFQVSFL